MSTQSLDQIVDNQLDARLSAEFAPGTYGAPDFNAIRTKVVAVLKQAQSGIDAVKPVTPAQFKIYEEAASKAIDLVLLVNSLVPTAA